ncbi:hypothetical protein BSL82_03555 [Tardibacter chloracetimidivorans]|uniref:Uncharacterized protein n=2 Tax=Tardibacter chloracetimidivorans TaxID=1921510 RepID=A0A1L3ZS90_9SPHN|nr:hypothetical protein BSL82_03555 [Tardibacter chloracetimidivorans]
MNQKICRLGIPRDSISSETALDIRFVFSRSSSPIYKGSKTTLGAWCEKNGFLYADKTIPEEWIKEK